MLFSAFELLLTFGIPLLILRFRRTRLVSRVGTVGIAYLAGMLFALIAPALCPMRDTSAGEIVVYVSIALAIPLLLFPGNIKDVLRLSRVTLLSFFLLIISVLCVTTLLFFLYTRALDDGEVLSGMAVALYTGGTPNLNAVACLFRLDNDTLVAANLSDMVFGGVFYLFLLFAAKPLLARVLHGGREAALPVDGAPAITADGSVSFSLRSRGVLRNLLLSVLITGLSCGIGLLLWTLCGSVAGTVTDYLIPALMLGTTAGGIVFSFCGGVSSVRENELMGNYFAAVFSYAVASVIDIERLGTMSLRVFIVYAGITAGAFLLHALLCRIFRIGADTMIMTATAGIYGPAFIPSVGKAIGAEYLLASGLIIGSVGYAAGTFLGAAYTYFLGLFI